MADSTRRFLVPVLRVEQEVHAIRIAVAKAHELALTAPARDILLLTPTDHQLRWGTTLVEAIGQPAAKALLASHPVALPNGVPLSHESERTFRDKWRRGGILAVYAGKSMLDKVDDCPNVHAVVVVPGVAKDVAEWARAWNPAIVGEAATAASTRLVESAVVEKAIEMLTSVVNLNNDLLTEHDRGPAVELLDRLHEAGERFDPSALRAWAIGHAWSPAGADKLREIAQAILVGGRIRGRRTRRWWNDDIIDQLRKEAATVSPTKPE